MTNIPVDCNWVWMASLKQFCFLQISLKVTGEKFDRNCCMSCKRKVWIYVAPIFFNIFFLNNSSSHTLQEGVNTKDFWGFLYIIIIKFMTHFYYFLTIYSVFFYYKYLSMVQWLKRINFLNKLISRIVTCLMIFPKKQFFCKNVWRLWNNNRLRTL